MIQKLQRLARFPKRMSVQYWRLNYNINKFPAFYISSSASYGTSGIVSSQTVISIITFYIGSAFRTFLHRFVRLQKASKHRADANCYYVCPQKNTSYFFHLCPVRKRATIATIRIPVYFGANPISQSAKRRFCYG